MYLHKSVVLLNWALALSMDTLEMRVGTPQQYSVKKKKKQGELRHFLNIPCPDATLAQRWSHAIAHRQRTKLSPKRAPSHPMSCCTIPTSQITSVWDWHSQSAREKDHFSITHCSRPLSRASSSTWEVLQRLCFTPNESTVCNNLEGFTYS